MNKLLVILVIIVCASLLEPISEQAVTYALTYFGDAGIAYHQRTSSDAPGIVTTAAARERARAPEPNTLILMLTGIGGILFRFAKKSFDKFKRAMDIVLSIVGLTLSMPILLYAVLLIKLTSKGPVIYKQLRLGKHGEIFKIYKLRTMGVDAEKQTGAVWAIRNDPRVTPVGRVLRKMRIDEIPQFFNVLKGEMSIVGPRPERPEMVRHLKNLIRDYEKRLLVKPGITGLAQVLHKYDEDVEDVKTKISYDLEYIRTRSLRTELGILGRTVVSVVTGKGAH